MTQLLLISVSAFGANVPSAHLSRVQFGGHEVVIEQEFSGAEEGAVIWDCARCLLAHIVRSPVSDPRGSRVLEVGSGTGVVGLGLAPLGAKAVTLCDKPSQLPLIRRNVLHNAPLLADCPVEVASLVWGPTWETESSEIARPALFDYIICCDCIYPTATSEPLAAVLLRLLQLNPTATILLAFEKRPPPASAPPGTDFARDFFETMRRNCEVSLVADHELDPAWLCDEISIWRMRNVADH